MPEKRIISWSEFGDLAEGLAAKVKSGKQGYELVIGILRGGGPLAILVADRLRAPVDFVNVKSYMGIKQRKQPQVLSTITEDVDGKHVLVVDDLVDEGVTMKFIVEHLTSRYKPSAVHTSALFIKPWSKFQPDYYLDVVSEWIVFPWELCEFNIRPC